MNLRKARAAVMFVVNGAGPSGKRRTPLKLFPATAPAGMSTVRVGSVITTGSEPSRNCRTAYQLDGAVLRAATTVSTYVSLVLRNCPCCKAVGRTRHTCHVAAPMLNSTKADRTSVRCVGGTGARTYATAKQSSPATP